MKLGIGLPVQGFTERARMTCDALKSEISVLLSAENEDDTQRLLEGSTGILIVRLDTPYPGEASNEYINRIRPRVEPFYRAGHPMLYFIIGNEPDIQGVDVQIPWSPGLWLNDAPGFVAAFRENFPGAALLSTPFSVERTHELTREYLDLFDAIAVHCYWQAENDLRNMYFGASWRYVAVAYDGAVPKPIYVTEINNSLGTNVDQIFDWIITADGAVAGMVLYIADASPDFAQFDVSPEQAAELRRRYDAFQALTPTPTPEEHKMYDLRFRDLYRGDYDSMVQDGSFAG